MFLLFVNISLSTFIFGVDQNEIRGLLSQSPGWTNLLFYSFK